MIDLTKKVNNILGIRLGLNKSNELARLVYEIYRRDKCSMDIILNDLKQSMLKNEIDKGKLFSYSKGYLLNKRFPELILRDEKFDPYFDRLDIPEKQFRLHYSDKILPERVFIANRAKTHKFTEKILNRLPSETKIKFIPSLNAYRKDFKSQPYMLKKRDIFITKEKFDFFKPCPCTKYHIGCGYYIMDLVFGCPMDCTYCYLQQYSNFPGIIINVNLEDYFIRFEKLYRKKSRVFRLGTGEFSDSMAFDKYTHFSKELINFFKHKDVLFELKTKTDDIDLLLGLEHNKRVVISWSLNPPNIIKKEELYTVSLDKRLSAAKKCQKAGYKIGFHFDPIIYYSGWEEEYKDVIDRLFNTINFPVAWISLGTLRFNPKLKSVIEHRFPESNIVYAEMVIGRDRKLRYPKFLREDIYSKMINWIRKYDKETGVYLCMESADIWEKVIMPVDADVENYVIYQAMRRSNEA